MKSKTKAIVAALEGFVLTWELSTNWYKLVLGHVRRTLSARHYGAAQIIDITNQMLLDIVTKPKRDINKPHPKKVSFIRYLTYSARYRVYRFEDRQYVDETNRKAKLKLTYIKTPQFWIDFVAENLTKKEYKIFHDYVVDEISHWDIAKEMWYSRPNISKHYRKWKSRLYKLLYDYYY